ncbi:hypothetical protein V474_11875 [Novosphingobium barchaimii LL02]|uniref:Uncharacterized protein n=1 Tax=Novosphingobium barchaimii LL02 TaxID=1114963 RepID=A0A0J7Y800_9SPHN|nr:hypothetical protein [Novosphingobium barchaimii]KMS60054.1 hypothetical protein V474_11875 [Novosphingobium barchaimii LL02]
MSIDVSKADIGMAVGTVTAIAGVLAHLKFDSSVTTVLTASGVIATALASYFKSRSAARSAQESETSARNSARDVANIAAATAADNTAKTVLVQTVTAERAKWRAEMRDQVERLAAQLRADQRGGPSADWEQVDRLRTGIRLRLNPAGRTPPPAGGDAHDPDRAVHHVLDALATAGESGTTPHAALADQLEEHMAVLLKGEWDKSKLEAVSGKLGVP